MTTVTSSGSLLFLRPSVVSSTSDRRHLRHLRHQALPELSSLSLLSPKPKAKPFSVKPFLIRSSLQPPISRNSPPNPPPKSPLVSNSTKTLAALFGLSLSLSSKISQIVTNSLIHFKARFLTPTPQDLQTLQFLQENVLPTAGPLFFAAIKDRPTGYLNTPLTVVASGMAKWLDIYSGVLMVRVLLSWFPNIPWDRQPLSAIRDLCDPYLNLFRNIIPPIFDTLDVSPLLAFAVLGTLGSILNSAKGGY